MAYKFFSNNDEDWGFELEGSEDGWPGSGKCFGTLELYDKQRDFSLDVEGDDEDENREVIALLSDLNALRSKMNTGEDFEVIASLLIASIVYYYRIDEDWDKIKDLERCKREDWRKRDDFWEESIEEIEKRIELMEEVKRLVDERLKELSGHEAFDVLKAAVEKNGGGEIYVYENGLLFDQEDEIFMVDRS